MFVPEVNFKFSTLEKEIGPLCASGCEKMVCMAKIQVTSDAFRWPAEIFGDKMCSFAVIYLLRSLFVTRRKALSKREESLAWMTLFGPVQCVCSFYWTEWRHPEWRKVRPLSHLSPFLSTQDPWYAGVKSIRAQSAPYLRVYFRIVLKEMISQWPLEF